MRTFSLYLLIITIVQLKNTKEKKKGKKKKNVHHDPWNYDESEIRDNLNMQVKESAQINGLEDFMLNFDPQYIFSMKLLE